MQVHSKNGQRTVKLNATELRQLRKAAEITRELSELEKYESAQRKSDDAATALEWLVEHHAPAVDEVHASAN